MTVGMLRILEHMCPKLRFFLSLNVLNKQKRCQEPNVKLFFLKKRWGIPGLNQRVGHLSEFNNLPHDVINFLTELEQGINFI